MAVYRVPLTSWASTNVDVETDETDPNVIAQLAEQNAYVSVCHRCADHLDVGDEWEAVETDGVAEVTKLRD